MNKLIAILALLSAFVGAPAVADIPGPDESVDCFFASNDEHPLCQK